MFQNGTGSSVVGLPWYSTVICSVIGTLGGSYAIEQPVTIFCMQLASLVHMSDSLTEHYPSNWLGRLCQIKRIRDKCLGEHSTGTRRTFSDFTAYC